MIDHLSVVLSIEHEPFGNILNNINDKTGHERSYRKEILVKGGATRLKVKSKSNGQKIQISGNFVKFLQGHNLFGSNNLIGLAVDVTKNIVKRLCITVSKEEKERIFAGDFEVLAVDLAANFRASSREEVPKIIREVERSWREQGKNVSNYSNETVYLNQHSKKLSIKFYDKHKELRSHPLPVDIQVRDRLLQWADTVVRAELTLGAAELKCRGLNTGAAWSISLAKQVLLDEIAASCVGGEIKRLLLDETYDDLPSNVKSTYRLWLHGDDVKTICGTQKFRRHSQILKKHCIDIAQPWQDEVVEKIRIQSIISTGNKCGIPRFAKQYGLIHLPKHKPT